MSEEDSNQLNEVLNLAGEESEQGSTPEPGTVEETAAHQEQQPAATPDSAQAQQSQEPQPNQQAQEGEQAQGEPWTKTAYLDEKRKRQQLEQELAALRQPPQQQQQEPEKVDFWEDPEKVIGQLREEITNTRQQDRILISQEMMRMHHADYDEKEAQFVEMAKTDPSLSFQLSQQVNPAKFVYETVKQRESLASVSQKDEEIAQLKAQLAQLQGVQQKAQSVPPSLSTATNVTGGTADAQDDSLEALLGR